MADASAPSPMATKKMQKFEQLQLFHTRAGTASKAPPPKLTTHSKLYWGCARAGQDAEDEDDADDAVSSVGGLLELYVRSEIATEADDEISARGVNAASAAAEVGASAAGTADATDAAREELTKQRLALLRRFSRSYYVLFVTEEQAGQMNLPPGILFQGRLGDGCEWNPTHEMIDSQRKEGDGLFRGVFKAPRVLLIGLGASSSVARAGVAQGVATAVEMAAQRGSMGSAAMRGGVTELSIGVLRTSNSTDEHRVGSLPVGEFFDAAARKLVRLHCHIPGVQKQKQMDSAGGVSVAIGGGAADAWQASPVSKVSRVLFDDMSLFTLGDNFISIHLFNDSAHFDKVRARAPSMVQIVARSSPLLPRLLVYNIIS